MNADQQNTDRAAGQLPTFPTAIFNLRSSAFICGLSILLLLSTGCQPFVLTDNTATDKILATQYWSDLEHQYSKPLVCWLISAPPGARDFYIGSDQASTVIRLRAARVTADGRVWVNSDLTMRTDQWVMVK